MMRERACECVVGRNCNDERVTEAITHGVYRKKRSPKLNAVQFRGSLSFGCVFITRVRIRIK